MTRLSSLIVLALFLASPMAIALNSKPVAIDSRIKTFIFSENEIFRVVINFGYQTSIEFGEGEEIQTISAGNNFAWQLTPIGRRLFIKPLEENILTNMTILTNKRVYQFEIQSKSATYATDEELAYVIRFFYNDEDIDNKMPSVVAQEAEPIPAIKPFNFNYTLSGPDSIAPVKVFDDGINTFLKFDSNLHFTPKISAVRDGETTLLKPKKRADYIVVNTVNKEFKIEHGNDVVHVYNENKSGS
jgi:type IV secretion system protein VirB9